MSKSYTEILNSIKEKFKLDMRFEDLTEEEKECLGCELRSAGVRSDLVYEDKFPILICLKYHLKNRDEWMKEARASQKELDKLKSSWYFKAVDKLQKVFKVDKNVN